MSALEGEGRASGSVAFADEARVGLIGTRAQRWHPIGERFEQCVQRSYKWGWLAVAVDPVAGSLWWGWQKNMRKESAAATLQDWSRAGVGTVVWDGAASHRSGLAREAGPGLVFQPPYSPEVNPVERLFRELRRAIEGVVYATIEDKKLAAESFLAALAKDPPRIKKLLGWDWAVAAINSFRSQILS